MTSANHTGQKGDIELFDEHFVNKSMVGHPQHTTLLVSFRLIILTWLRYRSTHEPRK